MEDNTSTPTNDTSEYSAIVNDSQLAERLASYSVLNSLYQTYDSVKHSNALLQYGLETAESLSSPVLSKLDERLGLEERGNQVLDTLEEKAVVASQYYQDSSVYVTQKKEEAIAQGKSIVSQANKQVNQLLDITEDLVDKILPPEMEIEEISVSQETISQETDSPLPRVKALGLGVPKRLKSVAWSKLNGLSTLDMRSPAEIESFAHVVDLIQYATHYIDVEKQKEVFKNVSETVRIKVDENIESVNTNLVSPVKEVIDRNTEDIKRVGVRTIVGVVASVAHAVEVLRRQVIRRVGTTAELQEELTNYTLAAKKAVLEMKDKELVEYINVVKNNIHNTLNTLVQLLNAYAPMHLLSSFPGLESFAEVLSTWRDSIHLRLNEALKDIEQTSEAVEEEVKNEVEEVNETA